MFSNIRGLIPCGEGAGYAGGIMSAAVDGVKCAEHVIKYYKNLYAYYKTIFSIFELKIFF